MAGGLGTLPDYLASLGTSTPDVGGGGLDLSSLLGQGGGGGLGSLLGGQGGGIPGIGSILDIFQGIGALGKGGAGNDLAGALDIVGPLSALIPGIGPILAMALPALGNIIGPMIQGLPGNVKPEMFADYMKSQGGLAGDLGQLIAAAQKQSGDKGVLSQAGKGAYNPNFDATLLEALTGQDLGAVDPRTGRETFTAPATGGVKHPVSLSFLSEKDLFASAPMKGLSEAGYTPAQLASPKAQAIINQVTNYGRVGTGEGLGTLKVAQYLPKVVAALKAAGIQPQGDTTGDKGVDGGDKGSGGDKGGGGDGGGGGDKGGGGNGTTTDPTGGLKDILDKLGQLFQPQPQTPKPWVSGGISFNPVTIPGGTTAPAAPRQPLVTPVSGGGGGGLGSGMNPIGDYLSQPRQADVPQLSLGSLSSLLGG